MAHVVTLIPGDGIGPEVSEATRQVLEATGVGLEWIVEEAGAAALEREGTTLPGRVLESIRRSRVALKGPLTTPVGTGFRSVNVALRHELDLFAAVRPSRSLPGVPTRFPGVDLVVIRENTEDLYAGIEFERGAASTAALRDELRRLGHELREDAGVTVKPISVTGARRIVRFAFDFARDNRRRSVTLGHKANIMWFSDGLFLEVFLEEAAANRHVESREMQIDQLSMRLTRSPEDFDVLLLPNLYGDILSDLCAGLVGGLGVAPGANIGDTCAVFEATHGSALKYRGTNRANPMALMLSGAMMLRHLGEAEAGDRLESAVAGVIAAGRTVTYDLKPTRDDPTAAGTSQVADAVIERIRG